MIPPQTVPPLLLDALDTASVSAAPHARECRGPPGQLHARDPRKRVFDVAVSLLALPFVFVISLPFAILIWLQDRRWPIYGGVRVGWNQRPYRQLKLRSMIVGAEKGGVDAAPAADPRITPVGHFIRRRKLDELPQLWNVLLGEMSLVGPRPSCARECAMYSDEEKRILTIRPGITDVSSIVFSDERQGVGDGSVDERPRRAGEGD